MKAKFIQKVMVVALAATLVAAPAISASASGATGSGATGSGSTSSSSTAAKEEVLEIVNESLEAMVADDAAVSSISSIAEIPTTSAVAGVTTTVKGVYIATSVNGTAITTSLANIASGYGLAAGETPYARIYNMDVKKSYLAAAVIDQAAAAKGAVVGPYVNVELGKLSGGKFSLLSSEGTPIEIKFGIPKSFAQADKTFAVVCVRPGGAVSILEDTDNNPDTITFNTTGGQGAYAIIKY